MKKFTVSIVLIALLAFSHTSRSFGQASTITAPSAVGASQSSIIISYTVSIGTDDSVRVFHDISLDSLMTSIVQYGPMIGRSISGSYSKTVNSLSGGTKYYVRTRGYRYKNGGFVGTITNIAIVNATTTSCLTVTAAHTNVTCLGNGTITLTVSGGTTPYTYIWSNGATTQNLTNVVVGTYSVTVKDSGNVCQKVLSGIAVSQNDALAIVSTKTNISCNGGSNGAISLVVSGGTSPYLYSWSNGFTTQNLTSCLAGSYTVDVTDSSGCTASKTVALTEPAVITATAAITNVLCNGASSGKIIISASGGTTPLSYSKNGINFQSSSTFNGLAAGNFNITIKDANACTLVVPAVITQSSLIAISGSSTNLSCYGDNSGTITPIVTGGRTPYTYMWGYGVMSLNRTNLGAGMYTLIVTDSVGCQKSNSFTVTQPTQIVVTPTVTQVVCGGSNTGSITMVISGGTTPYTYSWSDGPMVKDRFNLIAGSYTITIVDAAGCIETRSFTITQPQALAFTTTVVDVACGGLNNGQIIVNATGGTGSKSYSKNNGNTWQNSSTFANLFVGTYNLIVKDQSSLCQAVGTATVVAPPALVVTKAQVNPSCGGCPDGSIDITVLGGTSPYGFSWNDGAMTEDRAGLVMGNYTVTTTDASGCSSSMTASLITNSMLVNQGPTNITSTSVHGNCQYNLLNTCTVQAQVYFDTSFSYPFYSNLVYGVSGQNNLTGVTVTFPAQPSNTTMFIRFSADDFYGNHLISNSVPFITPVSTTGIDDPTFHEISLNLPNSTIKLNVRNGGKYSLFVYDMLGAKVSVVDDLVDVNVLSDLPAGVYIYQIVEGKEVIKTGKISLVR